MTVGDIRKLKWLRDDVKIYIKAPASKLSEDAYYNASEPVFEITAKGEGILLTQIEKRG